VQNWSELSVERLKSYLLCKIFSCPWSVVNMAKQTKEKGVTKDRLVGMKVVDGNGNLVGTVTDIAFTIGKMGLSLSIEDKEGETKEGASRRRLRRAEAGNWSSTFTGWTAASRCSSLPNM
jgi:hypothetical protein